jgi:hypothetical protein
MGMRRAQHKASRFIRLFYIIDIPAFAFEEAEILLSGHRLPDRFHAHPVSPVLGMLAMMAATHASRARKATAEATLETVTDTVVEAVHKAMMEMEMRKPLRDENRRA